MDRTGIAGLSARELRKLLRAGEADCLDVAEAMIAHVERFNPPLNAIVGFSPEFVRGQAAEAEARRAAGDDSPWLGIPVTVKDNLWVKDRPATNGSALFRDFVAPSDAPAVATLRAAGAVILGSTNCSEFACKGLTVNPLHGETLNPWDVTLTPGGSSGGGAAAAAAGMGCVAIATDAGGSVRRPASHAGLVGMKPSAGRVSHAGGFDEPHSGGVSVVGSLTRCVADAVDTLELLAGMPPRDPDAAAAPPLDAATAAARRARPRVGFSPCLGLDFAVDEHVARQVALAVRRLADTCDVEEADPRWHPDASEEALMPLQHAGLAAIYGERWRTAPWDADPDIARQIEAGLSLSGLDVARALALRGALQATLHDYFAHYDFLVTPTTPVTAWPAGRLGPAVIGGRPASTRGHAVFTPIFNHCLVPACSVPCDVGDDGLPVGLQIVGPRFSDRGVLALAEAVETRSSRDFSRIVTPEGL